MKIEKTPLPGVLLLHPDVYGDDRGYFFESFREPHFIEEGLPTHFVQDNQALSTKEVLRGLHYQLHYPQGKLVRVSLGEVFDVAVDIRRGSPTFGQWFGATLNDINHTQMYIPEGFAHGYSVVSDQAIFQYKCTEIYHPEDEGGLLWNDPDLNIQWPEGNKIISPKDSQLTTLKEISPERLPKV